MTPAEFEVVWTKFKLDVEEEGVVSWCQQICGTYKNCRPGRVCQLGIDTLTEMPADADLIDDELREELIEEMMYNN